MEKRNIFWGLAFIAIAVLIIVSRFGFMEGIGFWSVILTVAFAAMLLEGIKDKSAGAILFAIAFLCIVWDKQLHITNLTPWPVLGAALFGTIGCEILFKKKRTNQYYQNHSGNTGGENTYYNSRDNVEYDNGDTLICNTKFGSITKYASSENLKDVMVDVSFGAAIIYLDKAKVPGGVVNVRVDCSFGGIKIYIPRSWNVRSNIRNTFAGVDLKKGSPTGENVVDVVLEGSANFSGVEVYYI